MKYSIKVLQAEVTRFQNYNESLIEKSKNVISKKDITRIKGLNKECINQIKELKADIKKL